MTFLIQDDRDHAQNREPGPHTHIPPQRHHHPRDLGPQPWHACCDCLFTKHTLGAAQIRWGPDTANISSLRCVCAHSRFQIQEMRDSSSA